MKLPRPSDALRAPVFAQLLGLVLFSLAATLSINVAIVFLLPPPPPEVYPLSEVVASLRSPNVAVHASNDRTFTAHFRAAPAPYARGRAGFREMILGRNLADALDVPMSRVRVVILNRNPPVSRSQRGRGGEGPPAFDGHLPPRGSLPPLTERFIGAPFEASLQTTDGRWLSLRVEQSGLVKAWQERVLLCFALSVLVLIPLVYLFGRRLARPITGFARAAERLGRDPGSPPVYIQGPAEVEQAAAAFNEMQE